MDVFQYIAQEVDRKLAADILDKLGATSHRPCFAFSAKRGDDEYVEITWAFGEDTVTTNLRRYQPEVRDDALQALNSFFEDFLPASMAGVRLVSDVVDARAQIITEELLNCGMTALHKHWCSALVHNISFDIVLADSSYDLFSESLSKTLHGLNPTEKSALMLRVVYALREHAQPKCRQFGGAHKLRRVVPTGPRDNGERYLVCTECGQTF